MYSVCPAEKLEVRKYPDLEELLVPELANVPPMVSWLTW
jgi:hypothetical protein